MPKELRKEWVRPKLTILFRDMQEAVLQVCKGALFNPNVPGPQNSISKCTKALWAGYWTCDMCDQWAGS